MQAATEGDKRFVYTFPSNERWDSQNQRVFKSALANARAFFLKFGFIDLDHRRLLKDDILAEIGRPVEVLLEPEVVVKCLIYRGDDETTLNANRFWKSLTQKDPQRWYPSVGGVRPEMECNEEGRCSTNAVLWTNIGFAKVPVNRFVKAVTLEEPAAFIGLQDLSDGDELTDEDMPPLAKAEIIGAGQFFKAIVAGYGTNSATLTGGGALRLQSLQGAPHDEKRFKAAAMRYRGMVGLAKCDHTKLDALSGDKLHKSLTEHFEKCEKQSKATAASWANRLLGDLAKAVAQGKRFKQAA